MVARIPAKKVETITAPLKEQPAPRSKPIVGADPQGWGRPIDVLTAKDDIRIHLYYRARQGTSYTTRRYFIGDYQIAYASQDEKGILLFNCGPDANKAGILFKSDKEIHEHIRRMLLQ